MTRHMLMMLMMSNVIFVTCNDHLELCIFSKREFTCVRKGEALTDVPPNIPSNVTKISISRQEIRTIYDTDFSGLDELVDLRLVENGIEVIEDGAFKDLLCLRTLLLYSNSLTSLGPDTLKTNVNLISLLVSNNPGLTMPSCSLSGLTKLKQFIADRTRINFSRNLFIEQDCPDGEIPTSFKDINVLDTLTQTFDVSLMSRFVQLRRLSIGQCGIDTIQANLSLLPSYSIEKLIIRQFSAIYFNENTIENFTNLERIDIQGRSLYFFPKYFLQNSHFRGVIAITQTSFTHLPGDAFVGIKSVRIIILRCGLRIIQPNAFRLLSNLQEIHLNNNNLVTVHPNMLDLPLIHIKEINLRENPLVCDCPLFKMVMSLIETTERLLLSGHCQRASDDQFMNITVYAETTSTCGADSYPVTVTEIVTDTEAMNTVTSNPQSENEIGYSPNSRSPKIGTDVLMTTHKRKTHRPDFVTMRWLTNLDDGTKQTHKTLGGINSRAQVWPTPTAHDDTLERMERLIEVETSSSLPKGRRLSPESGEQDAVAKFKLGLPGKIILYLFLGIALSALGVIAFLQLKLSKARNRVDVSKELTCMADLAHGGAHE